MALLTELCLHPTELPALLRFYWQLKRTRSSPLAQRESLRTCYEFLNKTSRSFAAVIQELHPELREPVCLFYLILRGLDTVEDDVSIPLHRKCAVLKEFHKSIYEENWCFNENRPTEKDGFLLRSFSVVIEEFLQLKPQYQEVIADITKRMGAGMADFCLSNKQGNVDTVESYNLYCHYVAGLVGIGLSKLFSFSRLEDEKLALRKELSNSMGLFLQKTNIIRDYLEDMRDERCWWPREIWGQHASSLADLALPENEKQALTVLNKLCHDALSLIPASLEYLSHLQDPTVFHFCAIPQVMAISTLTLVFNNVEVFRRTGVKIRKGEAVRCIELSENMAGVLQVFGEKMDEIASKNCYPNTPTFLPIATMCGKIKRDISTYQRKLPRAMKPRTPFMKSFAIVFAMVAMVWVMFSRS